MHMASRMRYFIILLFILSAICSDPSPAAADTSALIGHWSDHSQRVDLYIERDKMYMVDLSDEYEPCSNIREEFYAPVRHYAPYQGISLDGVVQPPAEIQKPRPIAREKIPVIRYRVVEADEGGRWMNLEIEGTFRNYGDGCEFGEKRDIKGRISIL